MRSRIINKTIERGSGNRKLFIRVYVPHGEYSLPGAYLCKTNRRGNGFECIINDLDCNKGGQR